jgi:hypothetical protein
VAKPGLPHYHLLIIGAGMTSGAGKEQMELLCASAHCTFVPSTSDLSQLSKLLGSFKEQVRVRMQLLVKDQGQSSLTQWEGKENDAAAAAGQLLSQTELLASKLGGLQLTSLSSLRLTNGGGGKGASGGKGGGKGGKMGGGKGGGKKGGGKKGGGKGGKKGGGKGGGKKGGGKGRC